MRDPSGTRLRRKDELPSAAVPGAGCNTCGSITAHGCFGGVHRRFWSF